jgi:hypothetical protein
LVRVLGSGGGAGGVGGILCSELVLRVNNKQKKAYIQCL